MTFSSGQVPLASAFFVPPTDYDVELTASTSNPTLGGSGFIQGHYVIEYGTRVHAWVEGELGGSGANVGSGTWFISLPLAADTTIHRFGSAAAVASTIGHGRLRVPSGGTARNVEALLFTPTTVLFYRSDSAGSIDHTDVNTSTSFSMQFSYLIPAA